MAMDGINRPAGVLTPKVKIVMTHLKIRASNRCHSAVLTPAPAVPEVIGRCSKMMNRKPINRQRRAGKDDAFIHQPPSQPQLKFEDLPRPPHGEGKLLTSMSEGTIGRVVNEITEIGYLSLGRIAFAKEDGNELGPRHTRERNVISEESSY